MILRIKDKDIIYLHWDETNEAMRDLAEWLIA